MFQVFMGSLILSGIHAMIPNHWLPLIALGKAEKWTNKQTYGATLITGLAHTLSTLMIGILAGLIGYRLSEIYPAISESIAPVILILMGTIYVMLDFRKHRHQHDFGKARESVKNGRSRRKAILISLSIAMFLTPCIEIEAYYFQAGTMGWAGIFIVSAVYLVTTVTVMMILVALGLKGAASFKWGFLEHHEKLITGAVLILLGVLALFVKF
jgi:nickel/cobalt transporter (NicO) family protein